MLVSTRDCEIFVEHRGVPIGFVGFNNDRGRMNVEMVAPTFFDCVIEDHVGPQYTHTECWSDTTPAEIPGLLRFWFIITLKISVRFWHATSQQRG